MINTAKKIPTGSRPGELFNIDRILGGTIFNRPEPGFFKPKLPGIWPLVHDQPKAEPAIAHAKDALQRSTIKLIPQTPVREAVCISGRN